MADRKKRLFLNRELEYAKDYVISVGGETVYVGPLYAFNGDPEENAAVFRRCAVLSGAITALMLVCGFLRVSAMSLSSVTPLSYGLGLIADFVLLVSCIRLARAKQPMQRRAFDTSFRRLRWLPAVSAVLGAAAFVSAVVFHISHREAGFALPDAVFPAAQAAAAVLAVLILRSVHGILYHVIEREEPAGPPENT
ncbi:MAG: hypothetical protein IK082_08935 [Oscillospiraceae bacterium]|nr:hypothetical protein [Oscillospiraceae bacterium]